jgi:hypothetical protein
VFTLNLFGGENLNYLDLLGAELGVGPPELLLAEQPVVVLVQLGEQEPGLVHIVHICIEINQLILTATWA